jgi:cytochrome P450
LASRESTVEFENEPLLFLDHAIQFATDAFWLPGRKLCLVDPAASRAVLTNSEGLYEDRADFFHTRRGIFGPREAQVRIARAGRALLRSYMDAHASRLAESVRQTLGATSEWPAAANWLMYRHLGDALLSPQSPARLRQTVEDVIRRAVIAGARERYPRFTRALFRFRVARQLKQEIEQRRKRGIGQPEDLLDVVISGAEPGTPAADLAEVFLSFVFAVTGSIALVLSWAVYLLGTNPPTDAEPAWVVREALRLWPVAWFLGSRPAKTHLVAGVTVTPEDEVIVCPYAVQRNPEYWHAPASFHSERWATVKNPLAFLPFGWGPHTCPASLLALELVEDVLRLIMEGHELSVTPHGTRPHVTAALAPPRFTLRQVSFRH